MSLKAVQVEPGDADFMRKEIIFAAREKHFAFSVKDPAQISLLEKNIHSLINHHRFTDDLYAEPILFMKNHTRVGMVIMSEISPGQGGNEIHLAFIAHKHRDKGYGSQMLDSILAARNSVDVYARCAPVSQKMYDMLRRRGFEHRHTLHSGFRILLRHKQQ